MSQRTIVPRTVIFYVKEKNNQVELTLKYLVDLICQSWMRAGDHK